MKYIFILLPILLISCSKRESNQETTKDPAFDRIPNYPNVQFYIHGTEHQVARSSPIWEDESDVSVSFTMEDQRHLKYSLKANFVRSSKSSDTYFVTVKVPGDADSFAREIEYHGEEIEFMRDKSYEIGIRPKR